MVSLADTLANSESITWLDISYNRFSEKGYEALALAIERVGKYRYDNKCKNNFKVLISKGNKSKSFRWLKTLLECRTLQELSLGSICARENALALASELELLLPQLSTLKKLKLQRNNLQNSGVPIIKALAQNTSITMINLNWNFMGEGKLMTIEELEAGTEKDRLIAKRSEEKERRRRDGLGAIICDLLIKNSTLRSLSLRGNHLTQKEQARVKDTVGQMWSRVNVTVYPQIEKTSSY